MVKRVGLGVPATFLTGSDYVSQKAFISVYHRCAKLSITKFKFTIFHWEQISEISGAAERGGGLPLILLHQQLSQVFDRNVLIFNPNF